MCKYCDKSDTDYRLLNIHGYEYSGIEISMNSRGSLRVRTYKDLKPNSLFDSQDIFRLNYCPVCGREF